LSKTNQNHVLPHIIKTVIINKDRPCRCVGFVDSCGITSIKILVTSVLLAMMNSLGLNLVNLRLVTSVVHILLKQRADMFVLKIWMGNECKYKSDPYKCRRPMGLRL
jgi:hypothetical protein